MRATHAINKIYKLISFFELINNIIAHQCWKTQSDWSKLG